MSQSETIPPTIESPPRTIPLWTWLVLTLAVVALAAVAEHAMGRLLISKSGRILLWVSAVDSSENSQQLADWYSFSHVIHGMAFYGLFHLAGRRWRRRRDGGAGRPVGLCLFLTACVEAGWELLENSSFIIDRYRHETMSLDYYGDSILNSVSDILCCLIGFALARRLPTRVTVALIVAMEVGVALCIRDNLTLNIIMLVCPCDAIRHWQMGR